MEFKTKITRIGSDALKAEDQMIVLFGTAVTDEIAEVSLGQEFIDPSTQKKFTIEAGDSILIGSKKYLVNYVGRMTQENMRSIGHVNLIFNTTDNHLASAVYLDGEMDPADISLGTIITYAKS
ncbi:PTS glucitol/sorbitol transporter subunit IIA [Xylocopilactobacillus apicola]|uniref:PTS sorbitol transporter subunit IIA n=1 Tax=Xylocopilactobacillus apicola TaxID=2932184 RepID=A0AAU9D906_9LACO|nr:PTS glucitol/sorbitol transporter subunit IIA [Xylocopilactobacillus apicola]BDR58835.1 hypothetical protein XA3_12760 [Xylocopilactobacillus apicola]